VNSASTANAASPAVWQPLWERLVAEPLAARQLRTAIAQLTIEMTRSNEDAFREFYGRYFNRLLGYLLVLTRGHEDSAREALQSALLRVVKHIKRFECEQKFWNWLTVLARTALVDQERKRNRYNAALHRFAEEDSSAVETHLLECLRQSVAALPADELALIEKKYFEELAVARIAAAMDTTEKTVESRLVRIRQKLKKQTLELLK
jgi:RNA polymerase sigma-70 factor (ECF subfamily)